MTDWNNKYIRHYKFEVIKQKINELGDLFKDIDDMGLFERTSIGKQFEKVIKNDKILFDIGLEILQTLSNRHLLALAGFGREDIESIVGAKITDEQFDKFADYWLWKYNDEIRIEKILVDNNYFKI